MRECDSCGRKMLPLFTTFFCPNDCDRLPPEPGSQIGIVVWPRARFKVIRVPGGVPLPDWVESGWSLMKDFYSPIEDSNTPFKELIRLFNEVIIAKPDKIHPGWLMDEPTRKKGFTEDAGLGFSGPLP